LHFESQIHRNGFKAIFVLSQTWLTSLERILFIIFPSDPEDRERAQENLRDFES